MANDTTGGDDTRVSIRLSPEARQAIDRIMELGPYSSIQEAIRRAISDELFLQEQRRAGWTVLLKKDSDYRELVWSN